MGMMSGSGDRVPAADRPFGTEGGEHSVPGREGPTNERILSLLQQVLDEVKDVKVRQENLEKQLARLAKTPR